MIGDVYEKYKLFGEKFNVLRNDFQVKLEQSKAIASICINIIFIVIFALGIAIGVVTTAIGRTITCLLYTSDKTLIEIDKGNAITRTTAEAFNLF